MTTLSRYRGCLLGLAAGDALGTTLEFQDPGTFAPLTDNNAFDNKAPPAFNFRASASAKGVPAKYSANNPASSLSGAAACTAEMAPAIAARFFSRPASPANSSANSATAENKAIASSPTKTVTCSLSTKRCIPHHPGQE